MVKKYAQVPIFSIVVLMVLVSIGSVQAANPIAQNDSNVITEGASLQVFPPGVLINDSDPEGGLLIVTTLPVTPPSHGTVSLSSNGGYTYIHDGSETSSDSFVYEVCDNELLCDTATVLITVVPVNDPPIPINDSINVTEGESASQSPPGVLGNDQDPEGDTLTVNPTPVTPPTHGILTLNGDGAFAYSHDGSESTSDSFVYQVCDNGTPSLCANATVNITISLVNDAPTAVNDEATLLEGSSLTMPAPGVLANDFDPDVNDALQVNPATPIVQPLHGVVTLNSNGGYTYTHNGSETTSDSFIYRVCDAGTPRKCAEATVYIMVEPVNDAPQPQNDVLMVDEGKTAVIPTPGLLGNDSDPENGVLTVTTIPINSPSHGTVTLQATGAYNYTHDGSETTSDSFIYQMCDNGNPFQCGQATVQVTITAVNDAPTVDLNGTSPGTGFSVPFAIGGGPVNITDTDLGIADPDDTHLETAVVTISNLKDSATELLTANTNGTAITASYNIHQGQMILTGHDTLANYRRVLQSITYNNTSLTPNTAARNISFVVSDGNLNSNIATSVVSFVNSKIAISVTPERQDVNPGETAWFTVVVTNTGSVPLTIVNVVNTLVDNCDHTIGTLNAGQINTYSCEFPNVTDSFLNLTQVSGVDPLNDTVSDSATAFVNVNNPILRIIIQPSRQDVVYDATANFTIGILNISDNVNLNNVTVSIPEAPNCNRTLGSLPANNNASYICSLANVTGEVILLGTVTATNASNNSPIHATDFAEVQVFDMALTLNADPEKVQQPGGTIQYAITVVNQSSNVALTLESLLSEPYGDITNPANPLVTFSSCTTGITIETRGSYTCAFAAEISGAVGAYEVTVTAAVSDSDNRTLQRSDNATVQMIPVQVYLPLQLKDYINYFDGPWEQEANNDAGHANGPLHPNQPYYGYPNDNKDYFFIHLSQPGHIIVDLQNYTATGQLQLFYQNTDTRVALATAPPYQLDYTGPAGTYYIYIATTTGFNTTTPYILKVDY